MKTLIPWLGSKRLLAQQIVGYFPGHLVYVEPFAGSLACLFAKRKADEEIVNDMHGELVNFWRCVRDHGAELERRLRLTPLSRADWFKGQEVSVGREAPPKSCIERARLFFTYTWGCYADCAGRGGSSAGFYKASPYAGRPRCDVMRDRAALTLDACRRLERVIIEQQDALRLIKRYAKYPEALIYCDPPYWRGEQRKKGSPRYRHEFTPQLHVDLAVELCRAEAKVIISYYDDPQILALYPEWHVVKLAGARRTAAASDGSGTRQGNRPAPEILLMNFKPSRQAEMFGAPVETDDVELRAVQPDEAAGTEG